MAGGAELGIGLAGLGVHGSRYANHLLAGDVPGARLTAVCRRNERLGREFAATHGIGFAGSTAELVARPDVDAVVLALTPELHAEAIGAALDRKLPVLVEKPLATDARAGREVVERVEAGGTFCMVGHTLRFDPLIRRLAREVESIGPLRMLTVNQRTEPSELGWIDDPGRGGTLLVIGVHGFDLLRHLSGLEFESVVAETDRALSRRTEDQFAALIRLEPGGVLATVDNSRATHARSGRIELIGHEGQLWGDHIHRTLSRVRGRERVALGPVPAVPTLPLTLEAFVRSVADGSEPPVTARDGLAAVEMVEAVQLSAAEGRRVRLAEIRG